MKIIIDKILFGLFFLLAFFTPIIFFGGSNSLYEYPKMIFVYLIGALLIYLFFIKLFLFDSAGVLKKVVFPDKAIVIFLGFLLLSTIFSSNIYTSMWGYYTRFNDGLVSILIFFGIYFVGINWLDKDKAEKILSTALLSLITISIYGITQITENTRVYSTFGQPNWLAAYFVILIPLVLQKILEEKNKLFRSAWGFLFAGVILCFIYTYSISGFFGLIASGLFLIVHFRKKLFNIWGILILCLIILIALLNIGYIKSRLSDALTFTTNPADYRISDPGLIRLGLWKGTLNMIADNPKNFLLGTGPETFPYNYPFFREDILNYSSEWDFIMNKPHNYYLEMLAESGIFSSILYVILILKTLKLKNKFISAGLFGFYITNIFGWPTVYTSFLFWFFLIYAKRNNL